REGRVGGTGAGGRPAEPAHHVGVRAERIERPARRIAVPDGDRTLLLDPAEIDWIEAADYYARLHVGDRSFLLRQSLTELESRLDGDRFVRIHRSAIVQVDRIRALRPTGRGGYRVVLRDGTQLRLSRRRRAALEQVVGRLRD
ncbi:MAG: LytTR family DNA-binding domain-containing protein, partial [Gemmatimonadota bacterium]